MFLPPLKLWSKFNETSCSILWHTFFMQAIVFTWCPVQFHCKAKILLFYPIKMFDNIRLFQLKVWDWNRSTIKIFLKIEKMWVLNTWMVSQCLDNDYKSLMKLKCSERWSKEAEKQRLRWNIWGRAFRICLF